MDALAAEGLRLTNQGFHEFYGVETTDVTVWRELTGFAEAGMEAPMVMEGKAGRPATEACPYDLEYRAQIDGDLHG